MRLIALAHLLFALFCWKRERSRRRRIETRGGAADSRVKLASGCAGVAAIATPVAAPPITPPEA